MPFLSTKPEMDLGHILLGKASETAFHDCASGTVFAVFSSACYIRLDSNHVLMLHDARHGSVSFGIGIPHLAELLRAARLRPGMQTRLDKDSIVFPHLRWRFGATETYRAVPMLPDDRADWLEHVSHVLEQHPGGAVKELWHQRDSMLKTLPAPNHLSVCCAHAYAPFTILLHTCMTKDESLIGNALHTLVGLGPGLTPSMDDCLCGMIYVLTTRNHPTAPGLASCLREAAIRTTPISATFLHAACQGSGMEMIDRALALREKNDLQHLLRIGNNSGADILTGMLFGMDIAALHHHQYLYGEVQRESAKLIR